MAVCLLAFIFAGTVIVLDTDKGTLTIESEADNIPIHITQGDDVVKNLIVGREGATIRLHAGQYMLEVADPKAEYDVSDNQVIVSRDGITVAKVAYVAGAAETISPLTEQRPLGDAIREFNNLHSSDAEGRVQLPLTQGEVIARLMWLIGNGELSDEAVLAAQPIIYSRDRMVPAGWRFIGGLTYERCPAGVVQSWQISLETAGSTKPVSIRKSAIAPPPAVRKPTESPNDGETNVSLTSVIDRFNLTLSEIESRSPLPHQLPPLTLDEALAAVVLSQAEAEDSGLARDRPEQIQRILATHQLSARTHFELVSSTENAIGQIFAIESIRLVIPAENAMGTNDVMTVRHRFIELDLDHPVATRWSRPGRNGLQAGVRLSPAQRTYRHGQVVDIEIMYRSVTSQPVPATLPPTFQFGKVSGIRLERVSFVRPRWPDGSIRTSIGKEPVVVRGHRMQICFDSNDALKPEVNLKAITRPEAAHYVRFMVQNPGDDTNEETLEIRERLYFNIASQSPPQVLPLYDSHYFQHWGTSVPKHRRPEHSTPDPDYIDPFQMGVSLGPADKSRIPAYYAGGLQVTKVAPYSPAQAAGIEVRDILLSWEGHQIDGDDPHQPFLNSTRANNQLQEALDTYAKSRGWASFNMNFDLLDHRTGQVLRISPWFGAAAGGGPNKAEIIQRMTKRQTERKQSHLEP